MAKKTTPTADAPEVPEVVVEGDLVENPTDGGTGTTDAAESAPPDPMAGKVTLQAPPNSGTHITFQGVSLEIKDGLLTVEHYIAKHLREAFGFTNAAPKDPE
jgi:hypothetical protein